VSNDTAITLSAAEAHAVWAPTYDRNPNPLFSLEERIIGPLLPGLEELAEMVIVDIACGTGRWLEHFLNRGARSSIGFDLSPEMLNEARRKPLLQNRLMQADCLSIPVLSNSTDLAICSFAVSYVDDLGCLASELSRIVKVGGHLVITDFHPSGHLRGWKRSFRHRESLVEISSFQYSIAVICDTFALSGFELLARNEPCFGEAERPVFDGCGKGHLFEEARQEPAIFICHFRRSADRIP
jgi:ubiquinone/menaquinone biosynthesis C-methylase UbiE